MYLETEQMDKSNAPVRTRNQSISSNVQTVEMDKCK